MRNALRRGIILQPDRLRERSAVWLRVDVCACARALCVCVCVRWKSYRGSGGEEEF